MRLLKLAALAAFFTFAVPSFAMAAECDTGWSHEQRAICQLLTSPIALPTGGATSAKQDTGNTSAASIDTKLSSQATAALQSSVGATAHADAIAATPLPPGYSFSHISTATTTTPKSGAGVLHTVTVNGLGTVASTTTIYDSLSASGTVVAIINTLAGQTSYVYDLAFGTGLTLVTTGTVAPDITVSYL